MTDDIGAVFRQPFNEQAAFFRGKLGNLIPTEKWTDVQREAHDKGFMVAGASSIELLSDLAASVDKAMVAGMSLQDFRKDFKAIAARHGWDYKGEFNWRTATIYKTNLATSYNAGRLAQLVEGAFAYWVYIHSKTVQHPRREHRAWDGITLPPENPWWRTHFTPNGWGCMCRIKGTNRPPRGAITQAPDDSIDPTTGAPKGIDPGWDYMPGNTVKDTVRAIGAQTVQWEYTLAKAYMNRLPEHTKDDFARSLRSLPSTGIEARRFADSILSGRGNAKEYQTMGMLTSQDAARVKELTGKNVEGYDFTIDASGVNHVLKHHGNQAIEAQRGQRAVTHDDYERLPEILNNPDEVRNLDDTTNAGRSQVMFKKQFGNETFVYVTEIRPKRRMLVTQSLRISVRRAAAD